MTSQSTKTCVVTHYKDWPNTQGFDVHSEERSPVELRVEGRIPEYTAGVLFRTGLGPRSVETAKSKTFKVNHWFDGFSLVHRFQIHRPEPGSSVRVTYNSRLTSDGLIERVRKKGQLEEFTFAAKYDPCRTFFQKVQSVFKPSENLERPNDVNVGVTLSVNFPGLPSPRESQESKGISTLCTKTDATMMQMLDPETLEPLGIARQSNLHPDLKGPTSGAHAKSDPATGDVFNYNLEFGRTGTYRVFRVSAKTGKTSILATFTHAPAYLHSIFLTENYVVLCVWNSFFTAGGATILWTRNLLDAMTWDDKQSATWFVIDKREKENGGKGVVATYKSDPFFAFHTINAYEEPSKESADGLDIVADIPIYPNMDVLHHLYLDNLMSDSPKANSPNRPVNATAAAKHRRYRLPGIPKQARTGPAQAVLEYESLAGNAAELPIINPRMVTKKHRYMYGINDQGLSTFVDSLVKYDAETNEIIRWSKHGQTPGEPIFVQDPESSDEDGGVLLSVVLDGPNGKSYLMVLDAKTMTEIGRAHVDRPIGFGFHGLHVKERNGGQGELALNV
ncbi:hypothetical protein B0A52_08712 [Exophiala mesophila]|uniref:Dioxygenase n=1 Tax=Exophiala mesophila TaxID=212818 RepID=A0A438MYK5_EXOME|nr:hypothetical protein B0A52_08712 [Exophiala mesophila]